MSGLRDEAWARLVDELHERTDEAYRTTPCTPGKTWLSYVAAFLATYFPDLQDPDERHVVYNRLIELTGKEKL
jgi:hypothetical protein